MPERVTIDVTVARDLLDADRLRHSLAEEVFEYARRGDPELMFAPQGQRLDADGSLAEQLTALLAREGIREAPQLAYPSEVTLPSEALYPGRYVAGFRESWDAVTVSWRSHEGKPPGVADRFHVETHLADDRDVFITDDRPLLHMCHRLRDEHGIQIVAMSLEDYVTARRTRVS